MKPTLTILVTGASRGIGKAIATELSAPGTLIILMSTRAEDLEETSDLCQARGAETLCFGIDLADTGSLDARLRHISSQSGPIDIVVNNAGVWEEKAFDQANIDSWDRAIDVNLKAPMHICKVALETMPDGGAFIFIGSSASKRAYAGGTGYCAGKFGLLGFAGALFEDVRERGIKVCSILPGVVDTDMHAGDPALASDKMIAPRDVALSVRHVLDMPANSCPTEIALLPQRNPKQSRR